MQFAQILVTDDQALKARLALDLILQDEERFVFTDEERADFERLAVFFGFVAQNPSAFAPTGEMARTVKSIVRRAKGPAQKQTRRKPRSQGQQKRDRAARKAQAAAYNDAVERYEKEMEEAQAYALELQAKFESEPKFTITDAMGNVILEGVPESMIQPAKIEPIDMTLRTTDTITPSIVLPPGVEA